MAGTDIEGRKLVELYHRYVGEPASGRDVYGYWVFVLGGLIGLAGVAVYQIEQAVFSTNLAIREVAIVLAAIGLPLAILGILVLLPVRRRAMQLSLVGAGISAVAIYLFTRYYPRSWYVGDPDYSPEIIGLYTVGIAVLAGVAMLVPVVTGEKGLLVEPELGIGRDRPPLLVGEADRDALFSVFKVGTRDWTWRIVQREATAESASRAPTDTDARLDAESVRPKLGEAGLLEITTAAFRLYRTEGGGWRWTLVREDGSVLATNAEEYADRDAVEASVSYLKEAGPDADLLDIRSAAFDVFEDDGRWSWRLLDDRRRELARAASSFTDESVANDATTSFVEAVDDARPLAVETVAIELLPVEDGSWRWRFVTADDRPLATSVATYGSRREAETAATTAAERLQGAAVVDLTTPGYEVHGADGQWRWRLRSATNDIVARAATTGADADAVRSAADRVRDRLAEADVVTVEGADYEVYREDGSWRWRFVTADRRVVAESTMGYGDAEAAEAAAEAVRERALEADLIEFEHAAFQQYESEGEWRWRLIDEDGTVMADSGEEYASKQDATEAMTTLKEHAPNAEVLEIESAAFELYRTEDEGYAWRLIDETGQLVASGLVRHDRRIDARDEVEFVRGRADAASLRRMPGPTVQIVPAPAHGHVEGDGATSGADDAPADDAWGWRLVDPGGDVEAVGVEARPTREEAVEAVEAARTASADASVDVLGPVSVQLRRDGSWHWRLVDPDREPIAAGERTYEAREAAVDDVTTLTEHAAAAPVFELGDGLIWIDRTDGAVGDGDGADATEEAWGWRLVDGERRVVARSGTGLPTREAAVEAVETVKARAPDAELIAFEGAAFELYRDPDDASAWRWRLLDADETVMAAGAVAFDRRRDVEATIEDVRMVVPEASILEIDEASYELHRRSSGWIWRLVDENGTTLVESVTAHSSRKEARDEMADIKRYAPEGRITVTR